MTDENIKPEQRRIVIPERTASALERRVEGTEFETIDEYATFALEQLLRELRRRNEDIDREEATSETETENATEEALEGRLESLGYL